MIYICVKILVLVCKNFFSCVWKIITANFRAALPSDIMQTNASGHYVQV